MIRQRCLEYAKKRSRAESSVVLVIHHCCRLTPDWQSSVLFDWKLRHRFNRHDETDHYRVPFILLRPHRGRDRRHLAERAREGDTGEQGTAEQRQIQPRRKP